MSDFLRKGRLTVAPQLLHFIEDELLPGTGIDSGHFWREFDQLVHDLAPLNRGLLEKREFLQAKLDAWHRANPGQLQDKAAYRAFLQSIGYLQPLYAPQPCGRRA